MQILAAPKRPDSLRRADRDYNVRVMIEFHYVPSGDHHLATSVSRPGEAGGAAPWPTVIVVHGLTGNRMGRSYHLVDFARRLAEVGIACVRFDQAGCGESTGRFRELTIPRMTDDVTAVVEWTRAQLWCDADRVGLLGLSLGGLAVVAAEARTGSRGVALWAPVYDMPRVFQDTAKTGLRALLEHQGWVPYRGLQIGKSFVDQLDACDASEALAASNAPIRIYHSDTDETVNIREGRSYLERCQALGRPCSLERFMNASHDFHDYPDRQRLLDDTVAFFQNAL